MQTRRLTKLSLLAAAMALAGAAGRSAAQQPDARTDARLERPVSVEGRSADVRDVVTRLSDALDVEMTAQPATAGRRVTLYANKASLFSIQQALAALYHARWQKFGEGDQSRYELVNNTQLQAQADRIRQTRRAEFVNRLLQTEADLRRRDPEAVAAEFRLDVSGRVPDLSGRPMEDLTPDFLRQSLLLAPLRMGMTGALARNGGVWAAFGDLPAGHQQLLADFYLYREDPNAGRAAVEASGNGERVEGAAETVRASEGVLGPQVLDYPQARLEYRVLYGDRWTGPVLLARVGSSDNWATAMLPSVLFDLPDYATLYPEAAFHPGDPMLDRNLNVRIDTAALTWDQAIATIGRAAGINVLTDSYLRPSVFRPKGPSPIIVGTTIRETLDRTARYYGYAWWRHGDFFLFRHRQWAEEQRVSPPERVTQAISASLADGGRLGSADWKALSGLTDEQLLTLNLYAKAAGRPYVPADSLDLNEIQLQLGLMMAGQMTDSQLSMARRDGLPYYRMSDAQQQLFVYAAYDRGLPIMWEEATRWRWRIDENFSRQRLPAGWAEAGDARFTFDFGPAGRRTTDLSLRVPAAERSKE